MDSGAFLGSLAKMAFSMRSSTCFNDEAGSGGAAVLILDKDRAQGSFRTRGSSLAEACALEMVHN